MKTKFTKQTEISRKWFVVDASDQIVGRLATKLAKVLVGKHKATYTPHVDNGDYVVVVNADKVRFTGNKWEDKKYHRHSTRAGQMKTRTAKEMLVKRPTEILRLAVWGMLNKTHLSRRQLMKLKLYTGAQHPHHAQKIEQLNLN
jgi:large subunit ribosomal protein L13